jgi:CheY-like chemotaxis protein
MKPTILLAEDNPQDVFLTRRAFRKAGVDADLQVVSNGSDVVAEIRRIHADESVERPRLLLLDLRLPRLSGHEILSVLQQEKMALVPAVVLSTSEESVDISQALELGAQRYLCKPLRADQLVTLLQDLGMTDLLP